MARRVEPARPRRYLIARLAASDRRGVHWARWGGDGAPVGASSRVPLARVAAVGGEAWKLWRCLGGTHGEERKGGRAVCRNAPGLGHDDAANPFDQSWTTGIFKVPVARDRPTVGPGVRWATARPTGSQPRRPGQGGLRVLGGITIPRGDARSASTCSRLAPSERTWTIEGLDEQHVCIGDIWWLGDAVSADVPAAGSRAGSWLGKWRRRTLTDEVVASGHTGWSFRVLRAGTGRRAGSELSLIGQAQSQNGASRRQIG